MKIFLKYGIRHTFQMDHFLFWHRRILRAMTDWHNETVLSHQEQEPSTDEYQRSECVLGYIPVIYYSILLCGGFPGKKASGVSLVAN